MRGVSNQVLIDRGFNQISYKEKEQESRCLYMSDSQPLALCTMSYKLHYATL